METKEKNGMRMYFFVMYNLSGIQKGIQAGHAALEFYREYGKRKAYKEFVDHHKTFILLDGGGSIQMDDRLKELNRFGIEYAYFREPDLNDSISAIAFIVPESIYNYEYPDDVGNGAELEWNAEIYEWLKLFRLASN